MTISKERGGAFAFSKDDRIVKTSLQRDTIDDDDDTEQTGVRLQGDGSYELKAADILNTSVNSTIVDDLLAGRGDTSDPYDRWVNEFKTDSDNDDGAEMVDDDRSSRPLTYTKTRKDRAEADAIDADAEYQVERAARPLTYTKQAPARASYQDTCDADDAYDAEVRRQALAAAGGNAPAPVVRGDAAPAPAPTPADRIVRCDFPTNFDSKAPAKCGRLGPAWPRRADGTIDFDAVNAEINSAKSNTK